MDVSSKIDLGAVRIHKNVIASIASIAALEIEGVKQVGKIVSFDVRHLLGLNSSKAIKVEFGKNDDIELEIPIVIKYGCNIPEIAERLQENIRQAVEKMVDRIPRNISINIQGVEKS